MSYSSPAVEDTLRALRDEGCTRLLVLPLYPQSARSTTGSVSDSVARALKKMRWDVPVDFIDNYHDDPTYVRAIAASIRHAGFDPESDDRLLFSYHSIPLVDIEAGDTYELQVGASSLQIASELGLDRNRWTIGYQCRFDKGREWLSPYTTRRAVPLGRGGRRARVPGVPELRGRLSGDALRRGPRAQAVLLRPDAARRAARPATETSRTCPAWTAAAPT